MREYIFTDSLKSDDYKKILDLRVSVFVDELGGSKEVEIHDEEKCVFLGCFENDECIATGRIYIPNTEQLNGENLLPRLQRIAVKKEYRNTGIGSELIEKLEERCVSMNIPEVEICARMTALNFYKNLGYEQVGDIFKRDGFDHIVVKKVL